MPVPELYTYKSLAEALEIKPQTLRLMVSQGRGPRPSRPGGGRIVRFTAEAVAEWIAAGTEPPEPPVKRGPGRPRLPRAAKMEGARA